MKGSASAVVSSSPTAASDIVLGPDPDYDPDLLFSAYSSAITVGAPWPTTFPAGGALTPIHSPGVQTFGGVQWEKNDYGAANGYRQGGPYSSIPCNGVSIVAAVRPSYVSVGGEPRGEIVDIMYDRLALAISHADGRIMVARNGNWGNFGPAIPDKTPTVLSLVNNGPIIPDGQRTVLSLVVQSTGEYKVFTNGVEIMNVTSTSDMTALVPGVNGFEKYINVGRNDPDGWTTFNGNIGDVFLYKVALTDVERQQVESILKDKFAPGLNLKATVSVDPVSGDATITFNTVPGLSYKVEYADALPAAPTDWFEVFPGVNIAIGPTMSVVDIGATSASAQRFYRVVQVP